MGVIIEALAGLMHQHVSLLAGGRYIAQPVLGIRLPEPVGRHAGKAAKTLLARLQRQRFQLDLFLQAGSIGDVDQRLGDERTTALHGRLALEIEGPHHGVTADEHTGKTGSAQARHHHAGPALNIGQRRQFGQLGRIIDDQGLSLDGAREQRGQLPAVPTSPSWVLRWVMPPSPSQATTSACSKPMKGLST